MRENYNNETYYYDVQEEIKHLKSFMTRIQERMCRYKLINKTSGEFKKGFNSMDEFFEFMKKWIGVYFNTIYDYKNNRFTLADKEFILIDMERYE